MSELIEMFRGSDDVVRQRTAYFMEAMENDVIDSQKLSIAEVYEATCGVQLSSRALANARDNGILREEVSGPRLSAFSNIIGKMVLDGVLMGYKSEELIMDKIFDVFTEKQDGGRWGGITQMDDSVLEVKEGEEYPNATLTEDYVDTPYSQKRGLKIGLTREAVHFDLTGRLLQEARQVGERVGVNRENRMIDCFLGLDNPYKRRGVIANTYVNSGPRDNTLSGNELVNYTNIEAMLNVFADMRDDRAVPEPISVMPKQLVVMPHKLFTAKSVLNATEIRTIGGAVETLSANPLMGAGYEIISNNRIYSRLLLDHTDIHQPSQTFSAVPAADAKKYMFFGDFKRTFKYRTIFPLGVITAGADHPDMFNKDIVAQFRADERGVPFVVDPWYVLKSTG